MVAMNNNKLFFSVMHCRIRISVSKINDKKKKKILSSANRMGDLYRDHLYVT
jgi:hypothetical protein